MKNKYIKAIQESTVLNGDKRNNKKKLNTILKIIRYKYCTKSVITMQVIYDTMKYNGILYNMKTYN